MKELTLEKLAGQKITWVKPGESVPMMQGMALQKLNREYPTKNQSARMGYFLYSPMLNNDPLGLPEACYYLIERMVLPETFESGSQPVKAMIAFEEMGDSIKGSAIIY